MTETNCATGPGVNPDRNAEILNRWAQKQSTAVIARALKISRGVVSGVVHRAGAGRGISTAVSEAKRQEMRDAFAADAETLSAIARRLGVHLETVRREARRVGYKVRPGPRPSARPRPASGAHRPCFQPRPPRPPVAHRAPSVPIAPPAPPVSYAEPDPVPIGQRRSIMTVQQGECRWPHGDPGNPDFHLCGGKSLSGVPYCGYHTRVAYMPRGAK